MPRCNVARAGARVSAALLTVLLPMSATTAPTAVGASATLLTELPPLWVDDRGQSFDLRSVVGQTVVLTMAYATCHRVCPATISRLQQLQRDYDRRGTTAQFVVIGYDPDNDDAAAWHQYRNTRHLTRSNWHFLVGTRASVEQTARQLGFDFWKYDQHVMHDSRIVFFDAHGGLIASADAQVLQNGQR